MHIALFGGSFNPPHLGHVLCAVYALQMGEADQVWVLPVAKHPYGKDLLPWEQRWQLCHAAFAGIPAVHLRDDERRSTGYTVDLVEGLHVSHPLWRFSLIGGTDTVADLPRWHRGTDLARQVGVIAVPRRGYDDHPAALPAISSSQVRELIAAGGDWQSLVPRRVAAAIRAGGWYAAG